MMFVMPLKPASNTQLQKSVAYLCEQRKARYEDMLHIRVSGRVILQFNESWQDIVLEYLIIRGCQGRQICLIHDVAEYGHCHFDSLRFHLRVAVAEELQDIGKDELKPHVDG